MTLHVFEDRVHETGPNVPEDAGLSEKVTLPPGVIGEPGLMSLTVTVQVVAWSTVTEEGLHEIELEVVLGVAVGLKAPALVA